MGNTEWTEIGIKIRADHADLSGVDKAAKALKALRFDTESLNFLFAGMALKRFGESFFRFAFNSWERYEGYQSQAINSTVGLTAAWEFLRFSIFNALGQSDLFVGFIDMLIQAFNWLSRFVNEHPNLTAVVAAFAGFAVVLGSVSMAGSVIYQLYHAGVYLKALGTWVFAGSATEKSLNSLPDILNKIADAAALPIALYYAYDALKKLEEGKIAEALQSAVMSAAGWLWVGGEKKYAGALIALSAAIDIIKLVVEPDTITAENVILEALKSGVAVGILTKNPAVGIAVGITTALVIGEIRWGILSGGLNLAKENIFYLWDLIKEKAQPAVDIISTAGALWDSQYGTLSNTIGKTSQQLDTLSTVIIPTLSEVTKKNVEEKVNPIWDGMNEKLNTGIANVSTLNQKIIDLPSEKHVYVYVHTVNTGGGGSFGNVTADENNSSVW